MKNEVTALKGNAVVGQSGGPTAAINATLAGVIRGALSCESIGTIFGMRNGMEGFLRRDLVDLSARFADEKELELLEGTPAAALGSCRKKLPPVKENEDFYKDVFAIFKEFDIRYFFYIGGNDSMDTVAKLSEYSRLCDYDIRVIGVPKTIDNDLVVTDHTPGFGSAAKYIATTMQEILRDCAVYTTKAVTIVEIMGRDAGWLTASSAIGRVVNGASPDLVYLPERAFSLEEFFEDVKAALEKKPNVVVAVSEGIRFADGKYVCEGVSSGAVDVFGHSMLSGTGKALENAVRAEIGCKVRSIELNLPQRCAAHLASDTDLSESVAVGKAAVSAAESGVSRCMMVISRVSDEPYRVEMTHADVSEIANKVKHVPTEFINARGNHVTDACCRYLLPLIKGERNGVYKDGLPVHCII